MELIIVRGKKQVRPNGRMAAGTGKVRGKVREKIQRFMIGRYGVDELNRFLMGVTMVFIILDLFVRTHVLYLLGAVCLILCYYRMLSRNISKRYQENQKYLDKEFKVKEGFRKLKFKVSQSRQYHIYKCPNCGQKIRIPRGKGKISIHCPKCNTDFIKRS